MKLPIKITLGGQTTRHTVVSVDGVAHEATACDIIRTKPGIITLRFDDLGEITTIPTRCVEVDQ